MTVQELRALLRECGDSCEVYVSLPDNTDDFFVDRLNIQNDQVFIETSQ